MSSNRRREFSLREEEIFEVLMADNSDDEDGLLLDEEDQTFLAQDMDAGLSTVEIEPNSAPLEDNILENQQPSVTAPSFTWRKNSYSPHCFLEEHGYDFGEVNIGDSTHTSDEGLTPVEIFDKVAGFENLVDQIIVPESVRYAEQGGRCFIISNEEVKAFFGMNFVMGYHCLPTFRSYWSTDPDMGVPYIANVMPINRFEEIRRNLHFSDNSNEPSRTDPTYDRAFKIRPILEHFNQAFQSAMTNTKIQAIDEHMVKFKGHNIMKQYVKNKPIKWGFKLCGPETGLGESVVLQLRKDLQGIGCEIYFDNFFNSPNLQYELTKMNIKACGTVRSNSKNIPKNVPADKNMKRGDIFTTSSNGISFIKWMDNKAVFLLTNFLSPISKTTIKRRAQGSGEKMNAPFDVNDLSAVVSQILTSFQKDCGLIQLLLKTFFCRRKITLNELLDIIETADDDDIPDNGLDVAVLPPINCNDDVTDEDSGEEDNPTINNLHGSQLCAEAVLLNKKNYQCVVEDVDETDLPEEVASTVNIEGGGRKRTTSASANCPPSQKKESYSLL
ncbi:PREDICTED: piggyBac transposable element-derived protein 3-like [Rhagoletis zephyria]|uniref:piggyBac transposable element-derived protein 3-like n=1 Tax=Rhagoletis zephyria TaxID=28612 RepID=UPI00081196E0|nr:PREDICTED: piggyBac transposable element-derived protein 3-like [Rhagoletis zephyria]